MSSLANTNAQNSCKRDTTPRAPTRPRDPCPGRRNSLELLGGLGARGEDGVRGERSFDLRGKSVNGEPMLLSHVAADGRELPPWGEKKTDTQTAD